MVNAMINVRFIEVLGRARPKASSSLFGQFLRDFLYVSLFGCKDSKNYKYLQVIWCVLRIFLLKKRTNP